jgi:uncharacterized protein (TIGR00369 family)
MNVHEEWMKSLDGFKSELKKIGMEVQLPPPSMLELGLEYLEIKPGISMKAKFPFQKRFTNPAGILQGGFLVAALDDVLGPLTYVTSGKICLTLSLNTTFLKAFTEKMGFCIIEAFVLQKTKSFIFLRADVRSPDGELMAHAESHVSILKDEQTKRD